MDDDGSITFDSPVTTHDYRVGQLMGVLVTFDRPVEGAMGSTFTLNVGGEDVTLTTNEAYIDAAKLLDPSGVIFAVEASRSHVEDMDGLSWAANALSGPVVAPSNDSSSLTGGGATTDAPTGIVTLGSTTHVADLSHDAQAATAGVRFVNDRYVTGFEWASNSASSLDGYYPTGSVFIITARFNDAIRVVDNTLKGNHHINTWYFAMNSGGRFAYYHGASVEGDGLEFTYTTRPGDVDLDGVSWLAHEINRAPGLEITHPVVHAYNVDLHHGNGHNPAIKMNLPGYLPPKNLRAMQPGDARGVELTWNRPMSGDVDGYNVYRKGPADSEYTRIAGLTGDTGGAISGADTATFTDTVAADGRYLYRVATRHDGTERASSALSMVDVALVIPLSTPFERLNAATRQHLNGCAMYEDADGNLVTDLDAADTTSRCVPAHHVLLNTPCIDGGSYRHISQRHTTVFDDPITRAIFSYSAGVRITRQALNAQNIGKETGNQIGLIEFLPTFVRDDGEKLEFDWNGQASGGVIDYSTRTGDFEGLGGQTEQFRNDLSTMLNRLIIRMDDILHDRDYHVPGICLFDSSNSGLGLGDQPNWIYNWIYGSRQAAFDTADDDLTPEAAGILNVETRYEGLDFGPDVDHWRIDLQNGVTYGIGAFPVSDADLAGLPSHHKTDFNLGENVVGESGHLSVAPPSWSILDAAGDSIYTFDAGNHANQNTGTRVEYTATEDCTDCYIKVEHQNRSDWNRAGLYKMYVAQYPLWDAN